MVALERIELSINAYQASVIPFNYRAIYIYFQIFKELFSIFSPVRSPMKKAPCLEVPFILFFCLELYLLLTFSTTKDTSEYLLFTLILLILFTVTNDILFS